MRCTPGSRIEQGPTNCDILPHMKIERVFFWKVLFSLVGNKQRGLAIDANGLTVLARSSRKIPFMEIAGLSHVWSNPFFGSVEVPLKKGGSMIFRGVELPRAKAFAHALNDAWKQEWNRKLKQCTDLIQSLMLAIDRLEAPRRYPAACLVQPFWRDAGRLSQLLPLEVPDVVFTPEVRNRITRIAKFHDAPGRFRDKATECFIKKELVDMEHFFDTIEKNPLTDKQRLAVVCDEDATLVLAGAGSGKTSVITAKAAYLVNRKIRKPGEILLMAFGKDAAKEMSKRVKQCCDAEVEAMTFHKLAYDIIAEVEGAKPPLAAHASDDKRFRVFLREILLEQARNDREVGRLLLRWFTEFLAPPRSLWDFETKHDYYSYIESHELRTLQGERVRSFEELEIANWLCMNSVAYEYEPVYQHELPGKGWKAYTPDFRLTVSGVYLEHFGVRREQDENGVERLTTAPCVNREKYLEEMEWKREVHAEHGTTLVESYSYEKSEGRLTSALKEKLSPYEELRPMPSEEALGRLRNLGEVDGFSGILGTFLRHFKGSGLTMGDCRRKAGKAADRERGMAFLKIFELVYGEYQNRLGKYIDFEDMIARATDHVRADRYQSPYRHLLVDEFQDISSGRAGLLMALKDQHADARIFAVGDDWQSIFRFTGSDIHLMRDFGRKFGGEFGRRTGIKKVVNLGRTFRSVDRIAHPACRFILKNPAQIKKEVIPASTAFTPAIKIVWSVKRRGDEALERTLIDLADQAERESTTILLVGRYNWQCPKELERLDKISPDLSLSFKTIHKSKGLEADHVVILGADSGRLGLPSEIIDDPLLDLVLPERERYSHAEERRVFYVALTRARKTVTIISREDRPSCFVTELLEETEYGISDLGNGRRSQPRCSKCGGRLIPYGKYRHACEHRGFCDASLPVCSACGTGLPLRNESAPEASQCVCGAVFPSCPKCVDGWLVERSGKYGRFLGCVNYPPCDGRQSA